MLKTIAILSSLFLSVSLILTPRDSQAQQAYLNGEIIVKLKKQISQKDTYAFLGKAQAARGMFLKGSFPQMKMYHYSLKTGISVQQSIEDLKNDPNVEYAEPNYILTKASLEDGIQVMSSEEIQAISSGRKNLHTDADIRVTEVWESLPKSLGHPPIVAIIDTGLDTTHKTFVNTHAIWENPNEIDGNNIDDDGNGYVDDIHGWDFIHNSGAIIDDDGHGTHVSGIVLGIGQNVFTESFRRSAIQIMPLKFLNNEGIGSTINAIAAIHYAINNGAHVINNSWGGAHYSAALHEAVAYTYNQGVAFVAAAGNTGTDNDYTPMYPASYNVPHVMSIAATTTLDELAIFSNFGVGSVDLGSPGVFILSTIPGDRYGLSSGTSMAAPFVSGVAALMLRESPNMLGYQIKSIIFQEADYANGLISKISQESRVNVANAISFAREAPVETSQPKYTFTAADREIASLSVGGCGAITKIYSQFRNGGRSSGDKNGPNVWRIILFLGIILLPVLLTQWLRQRHPPTRRKYERFEVDSEIKVKILGESQLVGSISTISMGGVQLNTEAMLEQGGTVTMNVTSPDGKEQIQVQGQVVWRKEKESYGVQFAKAEESTFKFLSEWAKNHLVKSS